MRKILETSSMASGAVEGGMSSSTGKVVKKKRKVYNPFNERTEKLRSDHIVKLKQGLQLPRNELPQIKSTDMNDFKKYLEDINVEWEDTNETVEELEPIQAEINITKIEWMMQNKSEEDLGGSKPVIISSDGYLMDGHHRWFSLREMNPSAEMSVVLVDKPVSELLDIMRDYPKVSFKEPDQVTESLIFKVLKPTDRNYIVKEGKTIMINRHEFAEEIKLRGVIRQAIKVRDEARLAEEKKLRKLVRSLITEAETTDEAPSQYTGINVLADTLKKIIPQLEDVYKQLTTSPEQRTSFRAHIINAVQNALAPEQATEKEEETPGESPEDEEGFIALDEQDLAIQVASDPSFIDIDPQPEPEPEPEGPCYAP